MADAATTTDLLATTELSATMKATGLKKGGGHGDGGHNEALGHGLGERHVERGHGELGDRELGHAEPGHAEREHGEGPGLGEGQGRGDCSHGELGHGEERGYGVHDRGELDDGELAGEVNLFNGKGDFIEHLKKMVLQGDYGPTTYNIPRIYKKVEESKDRYILGGFSWKTAVNSDVLGLQC
ncbi:hypothetical protein V7S43_012425 [Phytophthora oleae]|uniref:Uncharacterized protein n=1 Tax=Phytophthora oleae TaxID=2107226 RepID=A0ABD3F9D2_9STRA